MNFALKKADSELNLLRETESKMQAFDWLL